MPNPCHDRLFLRLTTQTPAHATVELYDLLGRMVYCTEVSCTEGLAKLVLPDALSSGMYLLKCEGLTAKVIKR